MHNLLILTLDWTLFETILYIFSVIYTLGYRIYFLEVEIYSKEQIYLLLDVEERETKDNIGIKPELLSRIWR